MTPSFLARLKERKLVQWALAYLAGAWLLLQVFGELRDNFGWSPVYGRLLTVLLAVGFLAALVLAWYHGEKGYQRVTGMEVLLLGGILLIAGAAVAWVGRGAAEGPAAEGQLAAAATATAEQSSIAVLPFADMSPTRDQEYLSEGVAEEILNALSQVPGLRVAARTSSFAFRDSDVPVDEIAARLRVAHVLEGSVQRSGDRLRITAKLVDARTGYQLWSQRFDRQLTDIFAIQDEISRAIADALRVRLSGGGEVALVAAPTSDLVAYELYLKGLQFVGRRRVPQAMEHFRKAIERDPSYARAHAGLAESYALLAPFTDQPPLAVRERGIASAQAALRLDPTLADAHAALGLLEILAFRWGEAEAALRRALELDPRSSRARFYLALGYLAQWRLHDGFSEIQQARELDPLSVPINALYGAFLRDLGRLEEAESQFRATVELDPSFPLTVLNLGATYERMGRQDEAVRWQERAVTLLPGSVYQGHLGRAYARAGRTGDARRILEELQARAARGEYVSPGAIGSIHLHLGEHDEGYTWLNRAVEERDVFVGIYGQLSIEWVIAPYRDDPRFQRLRRQMGLPP